MGVLGFLIGFLAVSVLTSLLVGMGLARITELPATSSRPVPRRMERSPWAHTPGRTPMPHRAFVVHHGNRHAVGH